MVEGGFTHERASDHTFAFRGNRWTSEFVERVPKINLVNIRQVAKLGSYLNLHTVVEKSEFERAYD
jgi:hypothetical protein